MSVSTSATLCVARAVGHDQPSLTQRGNSNVVATMRQEVRMEETKGKEGVERDGCLEPLRPDSLGDAIPEIQERYHDR